MCAILRVKTEDIDTMEKRGSYSASIIGCGRKGILCALSFAEAGFRVICTDADQHLMKNIAKGKVPFFDKTINSRIKRLVRKGQLSATNELKSAVSQSDIILMTITAKIDGTKDVDYSEVESSCKQAGSTLRRGVLFIYAGISSLGFTEGIIKEALENTSGLKVGEDFGFVYCPLPFFKNQLAPSITELDLRIASTDKKSLRAASIILEAVTRKPVVEIADFKTAEAAVLFAGTKQYVNLALANELALFCERGGIDYFEVLHLLRFHPQSFYPTVLQPDDNRDKSRLLLESAENLDTKLRIPRLVIQINERMIRHAISLTKDALRICGKSLRRARIAVLGGEKSRTTMETFVGMLEAKGARVNLYDPILSKNELLQRAYVFSRSLNAAVEGTDCLVILDDQDQFKRLNLKKVRAIMKIPAAIVDLAGIIDVSKVESSGFAYRGLGRGVIKR